MPTDTFQPTFHPLHEASIPIVQCHLWYKVGREQNGKQMYSLMPEEKLLIVLN